MKNVLHITAQANYDGTYIYALRLCQNLIGFNHTLLSCYKGSASGEVDYFPFQKKYLFERVHKKKFDLVLKFIFFVKFIGKKKYDVIHYHSGGILILFLISFYTKSKVIHHIHCSNLNCKFSKSLNVFEKFLYHLLNRKTIKLAVSNNVTTIYQKYFKNPTNLFLLKNAVPFNFTKKSFRTNTIGYFGQLSATKNFDVIFRLVEAIKKLNLKLLIKGDIKNNIYLDNNIISKIQIEIPGLNISDFFTNVDLILFLSDSPYEGLPLVILEALAHDVTVICLKTDVTMEIFGEYNFYINNLENLEILNKLEEYYSTPLNIPSETNKRISSKFDYSETIKFLTNLYVKL